MSCTGFLYRGLHLQAVALLGLLMAATHCTFEATRARISQPSESGYKMRRMQSAYE